MANAPLTNGLINAPKPKPPKPEPSPEKFEWIKPSAASDNDRIAFAATLQELLPTKKWTHIDLALALWGMGPASNARNIGKARDWVRGTGSYPNETEAGYVAQLLGVSMQRLTKPKGDFNPDAVPIRPMKPRSEWNIKDKAAKPKAKAKANGHDPSDTRWVLPHGVPAPVVKFESSQKHPDLVVLNLQGVMPLEIAMAIMSMSNAKRGE